MCYSAQVNQIISRLQREHRAQLDYAQAEQLFLRRLTDPSIKLARAFESNFDFPQTPIERRIRELIEQHRSQCAAQWEQELFAQKKRLADAQRKLQVRETRSALEQQRIATRKIAQLVEKLTDLHRRELRPDDARIFPMYYAPIIVREGGERALWLARYHCRPAGKAATLDKQFPGLYNARRDNLEHFWREQFGRHHAIAVLEAFFENVAVHDRENRALAPGESPRNVVLQFKPRPARDMTVACLWSRWRGAPNEPGLLSFAIITDEPPSEIAAAGHNRCPISLKGQNVEAWLTPEERSAAELQSLLGDPERPYYEHEEMAA